MASTTFVNGVTVSDDDWFNDVNRLVYTILNDAADASAVRAALGLNLAGHIHGLTLSNDGTDPTNDISVAAGEASSNDALAANRVLMPLTGALIKRLDSGWVVGTNQGMLDTGSIADTTYHLFLIQRTDTGVVDVLASTSATSPTMPTNYTKARGIGSITRVGGVISPFIQTDDEFLLATAVLDVAVTNPGTGAVTRGLSVPIGKKVEALVNVYVDAGTSGVAGIVCYLSSLDVVDSAPASNAAPLGTLVATGSASTHAGATARVRTNTSAQIRSRISNSGAGDVLRIATYGWIDKRGR